MEFRVSLANGVLCCDAYHRVGDIEYHFSYYTDESYMMIHKYNLASPTESNVQTVDVESMQDAFTKAYEYWVNTNLVL